LLACKDAFVEPSRRARRSGLVASAMKFLRALIVSADKALRREASELLEDRGFVCLEAYDGVVALKFASPHAIDLIVADIHLPKLDGPELLDVIIDGAFGLPAPPLIMCSGNLHEHVWITRLALPGVMALRKPFTPGGFVAALDSVFPAE
jgi:CheY-like chemotaxis protein